MSMKIGGIASGLDTNTIIAQLMQIERQPIVQLQKTQSTYKYRKDAWNEINSGLAGLKTKIENLLKDTTFNSVKGTSSNEDAVSIKASTSSVTGSYNISVATLATPTKVSSSSALSDKIYSKTSLGAVAATDTLNELGTVTDGSIVINGFAFSIDADVTTVQNLLDAINGSAAGVTASYDTTNKQFTFQSTVPGSSITLEDKGTGFFNKIGVSTGVYSNGSGVSISAPVKNAGIPGLVFDGSGNLNFKINGVSFSFSGNTSLSAILDKVNSSGAGVTMFYDPSADRLNITAKQNGGAAILLEDSGGTNFLAQAQVLAAPQSLGTYAQFNVNGVDMTRTSNTFDFNGIEMTLKKEGAEAASNIDVSKDVDAIYNSIKEFVDQYNSVLDTINIRLSEEKDENIPTKGLLRGDSTLVGIKSSLRRIMSSDVTGITSAFNNLSEIGITTEKTDFGKSGKLVIDETKLKDIIKNNELDLRSFFHTDPDDNQKVDTGEKGLMAEMFNYVDSMVSTSTKTLNGRTYKVGILPVKMDSIDGTITEYDKRIADFEDRLLMIEERYQRQFSAMEKALSSLQNQSNWLSGQLAGLQGQS